MFEISNMVLVSNLTRFPFDSPVIGSHVALSIYNDNWPNASVSATGYAFLERKEHRI